MNIAVLGTGNVGKALSGALAAAGHVVTMGSRTADNEAALAWTADNGVLLATMSRPDCGGSGIVHPDSVAADGTWIAPIGTNASAAINDPTATVAGPCSAPARCPVRI